MLRIVLAAVFVFLMISICVFLMVSPGRVPAVKDSSNHTLENGTVKKVFIDVNGSKQGMFISSTSEKNPVLLFVHGGPGMPEYFLNDIYPIGLEKYFTVCWWDQRGAGISYSDSLKYKDISVDQNICDLKIVSDYLRNKYQVKKIFLLAHSWGTFISIQAIKRYPNEFYAYIGVGQLSNQRESEKKTYQYITNAYQTHNNKTGLKKLARYADITTNENTLILYSNSLFRDEAMHNLGIGTMRNMKSVITGVFFPSLFFKGYTITEKLNLWKGKAKLSKYSNLRKTEMDTDLTKTIKEISIPIVFMSGKYDYTVNWQLSKNYYDIISDTDKRFILFENSAHSPLFEERNKFLTEMITIRNLYNK